MQLLEAQVVAADAYPIVLVNHVPLQLGKVDQQEPHRLGGRGHFSSKHAAAKELCQPPINPDFAQHGLPQPPSIVVNSGCRSLRPVHF